MQLPLKLPSPLQKIAVGFRLKRDDLIHPEISGNKWRKLKGNIERFQNGDYKTLVTFGGAFSNHLYATAAVCRLMKIPSIAIIRGEADANNPTTQFLIKQGMDLHYVSRLDYRLKEESEIINKIIESKEKPFTIPEGGNNEFALSGVAEMVEEINLQLPKEKIFVIACGTGTTAAGIIKAMNLEDECWVLPILKHKNIFEEISELCPETLTKNVKVIHDYHFGGYAKTTEELLNFKSDFEKEYEIELDPIYTAKAMYGLIDLLKLGKLPKDKEVVFIHTGGLQGNHAFDYLKVK